MDKESRNKDKEKEKARWSSASENHGGGDKDASFRDPGSSGSQIAALGHEEQEHAEDGNQEGARTIQGAHK